VKKLRVQDAVGETLCHDVTGVFPNGLKGAVFSRGHVIGPDDVDKLLDIGKYHVFVWEPDAGEVHEEDAALALADAACGEGVTFSRKLSEGKVTIKASRDGLFRVDREALREINSVPDYTAATLPDMTPVKAGGAVCGLRIVPLVTKQENVGRAVKIARNAYPLLDVLPYKKLRCGVIITGSEVYYGRIEDKFEPVMRAKIAALGGEIAGVIKCPDDTDMILAALGDFLNQGAEVILLTGGMSVDPDDLTPAAIRRSGAEVVTQGMPMQPGNMLTIAYLDSTVLFGVPGASMFSKVTSLDVFLPRVFAGIRITREEIAALGEGGLCLNCEVCNYPACYFGRGV